MKCSSCGFEWIEKNGKPYFEKCPVCGAEISAETADKEVTASQAVKDIIRKYGINIISHKERFIGLFGDTAPKLKKEKKFLSVALGEHISGLFIKAGQDGHADCIRRVIDSLDYLMSVNAISSVIEIFVKALGWEDELLEIYSGNTDVIAVPDSTPIQDIIDTITRNDGAVYTGELSDGLPNGQGTLKYPDGKICTGTWKAGKLDGHAVVTDPVHGLIKEGEWSDGKCCGHAVLKLVNGAVLEADWDNDKITGNVRFTYGNGDVYEGELSGYEPNGFGKMTYANGDIYEGEWQDDLRSGHGVMRFMDGKIYDGQWKNDKFNGYGSMKWRDGASYVGEWKNGVRHGFGKMISSDGQLTYIGEWLNDNRTYKRTKNY